LLHHRQPGHLLLLQALLQLMPSHQLLALPLHHRQTGHLLLLQALLQMLALPLHHHQTGHHQLLESLLESLQRHQKGHPLQQVRVWQQERQHQKAPHHLPLQVL